MSRPCRGVRFGINKIKIVIFVLFCCLAMRLGVWVLYLLALSVRLIVNEIDGWMDGWMDGDGDGGDGAGISYLGTSYQSYHDTF